MYRLLIVDDEKNIREGLTRFIDYAQFGVEVAGAARGGREALEIIERESVQLVLTDIRMPDMDGLTLLREIARAHPEIKCVVLSGYDDFSFVRDAMQAGALTYLLKPVKRQELSEAVGCLVRQLEREAVDLRYRQESMRLMKNSVLNRLLMDDISRDELEEKADLLGLSVRREGRVRAAIVKLTLDRDIAPREGDGLLFEAQSLAETLVSGPERFACLDTLGNIVLILPDNPPGAALNQLSEFKQALEARLFSRVGVIAGRAVDGLGGVCASYRSALSALNYVYVLGAERVIDSDDPRRAAPHADEAPPFDEAAIRRLAQAENLSALLDAVDQYFDVLRAAPIADIRLVRVRWIELTVAVSDELSVWQGTSDSLFAIRHRMIRAIARSEFLEDHRQIVRNGLEEMFRRGDPAQSASLSRYTLETMAIVEESYADVNLSIKTIAGRLRLNAAYLGRTFQKDTGQYFLDYLNEFRIRKAKELLLQPQARIQEIGERVGYVSASYFTQVFKRQTGVNPSRWRK